MLCLVCVWQNKTVMGFGLLSITLCVCYLGYMHATQENQQQLYEAIDSEGERYMRRKTSKWDWIVLSNNLNLLNGSLSDCQALMFSRKWLGTHVLASSPIVKIIFWQQYCVSVSIYEIICVKTQYVFKMTSFNYKVVNNIDSVSTWETFRGSSKLGLLTWPFPPMDRVSHM